MEESTPKSPAHCSAVEDDYDARQWDTREDCEVRQILDRVADKWSLLVIALLDRRVLRFTELSRKIDGISQRMLTVTLRQLERDGLVRRTVHPVVPPRVDYELTPLGVTLHDTIQSLVMWTEKHQSEIASARADYDARADVTPAVTEPRRPATDRNVTRAGGRDGTRTAATVRDGGRAVVTVRDGSRTRASGGRCETCGAPIHSARTGRPARFCGTACRQKAHRQRARARELS
ncbi:winged helix-turn-helix transcriptional regulator [Streptosporangium sp. NPDC003464]